MSAEREIESVEGGGGKAHSRLSNPVFHALTLSTGRKALRLEEPFWEAIADIAQQKGVSRNHLLEEILGEVDHPNGNASSHVRAFVTNYLHEQTKQQRKLLAVEAMIGLMQQAPLPSFAMARDKRLIKVNREFLRLLQVMAGNPREAVSLDKAQLSVDTPLVEIFDIVGKDHLPHQCGLKITVNQHQRRAVTRVVGLPGDPVPALVGYILP